MGCVCASKYSTKPYPLRAFVSNLPDNLSFSIPAAVMRDKRLTLSSRVLFAEILAGSIQRGYCWATNAHFVDVLGISDRTVSLAVKELVKFNYIKVRNPTSRARQIVPNIPLQKPRKNYEVSKKNPAKTAINPADIAPNVADFADVDTKVTKETIDVEKEKQAIREMLQRKKRK